MNLLKTSLKDLLFMVAIGVALFAASGYAADSSSTNPSSGTMTSEPDATGKPGFDSTQETSTASANTGAGNVSATGGTYAQDATAPSSAQGLKSDAEIIATVMTINQHEIEAAQAAKNKDVDGKVEDFAEMMEKHHSDNLEKAQSLSNKISVTPATDAPDVRALKTKADGDLANLQTLTGDQFEKAYMDAMVRGHRDALNKIDSELIPSAQNQELKNFLGKTREAVASHLDKAQQIQVNLQKA